MCGLTLTDLGEQVKIRRPSKGSEMMRWRILQSLGDQPLTTQIPMDST